MATSAAEAVLARTRLIATLAAGLLAAPACNEPGRSVLLRPTPVASANWGPPSPGHHSLSGAVTEPDDQPVEGALVWTSYGTAVTDHAGRFRLERVGPTVIEVRKEGFESGSADKIWTDLATTDLVVDLVLARSVRIEAGARYHSTLQSKDLEHNLGDPTEQPSCGPCRLVRVQVPSKGVLTVHVEWAGAEELKLYLVTHVPPFWPSITVTSGRGSATAAHETLGEEVGVYLGLPSYPPRRLAGPVPFTLVTSFK